MQFLVTTVPVSEQGTTWAVSSFRWLIFARPIAFGQSTRGSMAPRRSPGRVRQRPRQACRTVHHGDGDRHGTRALSPCGAGGPARRSPVQILIARHLGIDQLRPGVDATLEIVEFTESLTPEVLGRLLTADAVVTLKDDRRTPIEPDQRVVVGMVQQTRAVDLREPSLPRCADIDQLERRAPLEQRLQLGGRELANRRRLRYGGVLAHVGDSSPSVGNCTPFPRLSLKKLGERFVIS